MAVPPPILRIPVNIWSHLSDRDIVAFCGTCRYLHTHLDFLIRFKAQKELSISGEYLKLCSTEKLVRTLHLIRITHAAELSSPLIDQPPALAIGRHVRRNLFGAAQDAAAPQEAPHPVVPLERAPRGIPPKEVKAKTISVGPFFIRRYCKVYTMRNGIERRKESYMFVDLLDPSIERNIVGIPNLHAKPITTPAIFWPLTHTLYTGSSTISKINLVTYETKEYLHPVHESEATCLAIHMLGEEYFLLMAHTLKKYYKGPPIEYREYRLTLLSPELEEQTHLKVRGAITNISPCAEGFYLKYAKDGGEFLLGTSPQTLSISPYYSS
jgi:hypothetical protein